MGIKDIKSNSYQKERFGVVQTTPQTNKNKLTLDEG